MLVALLSALTQLLQMLCLRALVHMYECCYIPMLTCPSFIALHKYNSRQATCPIVFIYVLF